MSELDKISVLKDDIDYAIRQDRWGCAIVRAIQREFPDATYVTADKEHIAFSDGGHRYIFDTPDTAVKKIIEPFDTGKQVKPCVIVLPPPEVKQRKILTPTERRKHREEMREAKRRKGTNTAKPRPPRTAQHNRFGCDDNGTENS